MGIKIRLKKIMARFPKSFDPEYRMLHLGCGTRKYKSFLNVDLYASDFNLDLSRGNLPFPNNQFELVLSQHFIEHLSLETELVPLIKEIFRILVPGGKVVLSTPDMKKITEAYQKKQLYKLINSRTARFSSFSLKGFPESHYLNILWHQNGEHKNLFDFDLLNFILRSQGFINVNEITETELIKEFDEIKPRFDGEHTIIVTAEKP
jgi:predicted SAM-dependent methyltransferase